MQFLIIFLAIPIVAISAGGYTAEDVQRFLSTRKRCQKEHPIDPAVLKAARSGAVVDNHEFDCLGACIVQGVGLMGPDGSVDVEAAVEKVPDIPIGAALIDAIRACASEATNEPCESAHRLYACFHEKGLTDLMKAAL